MAARVPTPHLSRPSKYEESKTVDLPKPFKLRRYYTPSEVSRHNSHDDCWVSFFYGVYDLSKLLHDNREKRSELCGPIGNAAGTDITHWFDPLTQEVSPSFQTHSYSRKRLSTLKYLTCPLFRYFNSLSAQWTLRPTLYGGTVPWVATFTSLP